MADERAAGRLDGLVVGNELSGSVAGPSIQAGAIHGGVHFHHAATAPPPVPRQLLTPSAHFTNREAELAALDQLLNSGRSVFAILSGPGGVGKTALALRWAYQVQDRFPDGQLYVDLAGFSEQGPLDPGEVLGSFLRALGVPPQRVPLGLAEQSALYRSVTMGRSLLVLLDNAYSAAQVRALLPVLSSSAVLVTSRSRLVSLFPDGARMIEVAPLSAPDAVSLLGRVAGEDRVAREREPAEYLARMCGGLPIAVCLAAARLAARPRLSVSRVAGEFTDENRRLGAFSVGDGPTVQGMFDTSYRLLEQPAAALYRRLSLHPGQDFGLRLATAVTNRTAGGFETAPSGDPLAQLVESNLLEELPEDRFRFHDLLRLHARERARIDDSEAERRAALLAMLEWYFAVAAQADLVVTPYRRRLPYAFDAAPTELPAFTGREVALCWLDRERANLISAGRTALDHGWSELAWQLCDVMWPLLLYRKHYRNRLEIDRRGVEAARIWRNTWAEADMLKRLGLVCTSVGRYDEAEASLRSSITLCRDVDDDHGAIDAQEALALLRLATGRLEEAVRLFQELATLNERMGRHRSRGLTLINLGKVLPRLGRSQQAVDLLGQAQQIFAGLTDSDPYNGARVLVALAHAHLGIGDLSRAKQAATQAARAMHDLGSQSGEAEALEALGEVAHGQGDDSVSLGYLRQASEIFDALGSPHATRVRERVRELGGYGAVAASDPGPPSEQDQQP
ncbi:MAG TPA: tetratricopeptide repeat protein [Micromonosporaceae bacterium]